MVFLKLTAMYSAQGTKLYVNADNIVSIQPSLEREGGVVIDTLKGPVAARESIDEVEAMLSQWYTFQGVLANV